MRTPMVRPGLWAALALGSLSAGSWSGMTAPPLCAQAAQAQGIEGTWQGKLHQSSGDTRVAVQIRREDGRLESTIHLPDSKDSMGASETTLTGDTLSINLNAEALSFTGRLAPDGNTISGTYSGRGSVPLVLVRATPETAWALPAPAKPTAPMDPKADPSFEVATIKPTRPDEADSSYFSIGDGGRFYVINQPLSTLLRTVYRVQTKQIVGLPSWAEEEHWDIDTRSDTPGMPTWDQVNIMMKKLLAERFALKLHIEQREMPAFVLTVAKGGHKMKPSTSTSSLYDTTGHGRGQLSVTNATMKDFASSLQSGMVDRPVVDQTGLGDKRFDFQIHWQPDDGKPANPDASPYPPLLVALPEEVGLKLEAGKAVVPVLVIDHVEKPSAN